MLNLNNTVLNFLDTETTGLSPRWDKIIEIFISKEYKGKTIKTFKTFINPGFKPSSFILNLTNINFKDLQAAPYFEDVSDEISDILGDGILVAHNARFDYSFLRQEFSNIGKEFNKDYCCTVKLFRKLYPEYYRHNLDTLRGVVNMSDQAKHRAEGDTLVLKKFYYSSLEIFGANKVRESVEHSMNNEYFPNTTKVLLSSQDIANP